MKCSVRVEAGGIEPTSRRKKERNASLSVCLFHCLSSHVLRKEEEEAQHLREVVSNACLPGCYVQLGLDWTQRGVVWSTTRTTWAG